jgi:chromate reductase
MATMGASKVAMTDAATIHVFAVAGSLRRASLNRALLRAAVDLAPEGMTFDVYEDLGSIPPYDDDVRAQGLPPTVVDLIARVAKADAILFATPEYNYSVPGVLKNAIDWASRGKPQPFASKACAIMGANPAALGAVRAQYHLRQICVYLDMHPVNKPEVFVTFATEKFDAEGRLTDVPTRDVVRTLMSALAAHGRRLKG